MVTRLGNKSMTATEKSRSFSEKNHLHRPPFLLIIIFSANFLKNTHSHSKKNSLFHQERRPSSPGKQDLRVAQPEPLKNYCSTDSYSHILLWLVKLPLLRIVTRLDYDNWIFFESGLSRRRPGSTRCPAAMLTTLEPFLFGHDD